MNLFILTKCGCPIWRQYYNLQSQGNFTNYLRLVDDLNYKSVLSLTGSKTIFPADDDAFNRFYQNNQYGVTSYEDLSRAQKSALLYSSMLNMSYLVNMLSNVSSSSGTSGEGTALRHATSYSCLDSISFITDTTQLSAPYWTRFKGKGLYLVDNQEDPWMVHFTPSHTSTNNINTDDISLILGDTYDPDNLYVNGIAGQEMDISCQNGYVHIMKDVLTPQHNLSQIIASNGQTNLFNRLMNKFSAPYYDGDFNQTVHQLYSGTDGIHPLITDSIFIKRYFTSSNSYDPQGNDMTSYGELYFDPSSNSYSSNTDMGMMLVPTDEAMNEYINGSKGRYLKDAYGSWDNIPTSLLALFIKNHQKQSFMNSLPSTWDVMTDEQSFDMDISTDDVVKAYIGTNGVVYVTNKVYPPIDYQCVYASVLTNEDATVMNAASQDGVMRFKLYLRSMENMYNFLVPTDEAMQNYRDPISWALGKSYREIWAFRYDTNEAKYYADIYSVNDDGTKGEFIRTLDDQDILRNRLYDILDRHIVVGDKDTDGNMSGYLNDGQHQYALTKGGSTIKISGSGNNMTVTGGGDIEQGVAPANIIQSNGIYDLYDSDNGRTYFIDKIVQDPTKSVYTCLQEHSEYSKFFELLNGNDQIFTLFQDDSEIRSIFSLKTTSSTSGLGNVVNSYGNFRYTVFIPTNDAVTSAFAEDPDLHTWDEIVNETDESTQRLWTIHLLRWLNYHFMDNSVYIDGNSFDNYQYVTAARSDNGKFQKLTVSSTGDQLSITDAQGNTAHVVKTPGLYNLQSRDFIVNNSDYRNATQIVSSSFSVIHLIDRALMPE
ncbi:MAG: adenylate cyclase [Prevotella sp.]|jgi:uncharacterized surface protein with fasciclin (FAS1) repeats